MTRVPCRRRSYLVDVRRLTTGSIPYILTTRRPVSSLSGSLRAPPLFAVTTDPEVGGRVVLSYTFIQSPFSTDCRPCNAPTRRRRSDNPLPDSGPYTVLVPRPGPEIPNWTPPLRLHKSGSFRKSLYLVHRDEFCRHPDWVRVDRPGSLHPGRYPRRHPTSPDFDSLVLRLIPDTLSSGV